MTTPGARSKNAKKNPCGRCEDECNAANGLVCGFCEQWFHLKCVIGMSPEYTDNCDKYVKLFASAALLCQTCRKIASKINKSTRELEIKMGARLVVLEAQKQALEEKVLRMEGRTDEANDRIVRMEQVIQTGMEKAKEEVKEEMSKEMKDKEARSENIVVYGVEESKEADAEKRKEEDERKVKEIADEIGVEIKGLIEVKFRAGKKDETEGKIRPMIVKMTDEETRAKMLDNARKLGRKENWKKVFLSPDLTWKQREEARNEEKRLKDDAEKRNEEAAKNEGANEGKWVVVGKRGARMVVWRGEGAGPTMRAPA